MFYTYLYIPVYVFSSEIQTTVFVCNLFYTPLVLHTHSVSSITFCFVWMLNNHFMLIFSKPDSIVAISAPISVLTAAEINHFHY